MDVTATQTTTANSSAAQSGTDAAPTTLNSDFATFLKMLTVQMQNQDPLNPVDSSDFAVQLATFSTVEQQVRTNDILGSLGDRLGAFGVGQLVGWVGMDARAEMPVAFDGTPVAMTLTTELGATEARLVVRNSRGDVVQNQDAPTAGGEVLWAGVGENGTPLPPGTYTVEVESYSGEALLGTNPVIQLARVVEARNEGGQTFLIMEGGQKIAADDVLGLRSPDAR